MKNICTNFSLKLASSSQMKSSFKPNILIATNEESVFRQLKAYLQELLGKTSYTIYNIPNKDLLNDSNNNTAWRTNCVLLITTATIEKENNELVSRVYLDYMRQGGRILTIPAAQDDLNLPMESTYRDESLIECSKIDSLVDKYAHKESQGRHLVLKVCDLIK